LAFSSFRVVRGTLRQTFEFHALFERDARLFQVPEHGITLVLDRPARGVHGGLIFEPQDHHLLGLARGRGLPALLLPDLGEGARLQHWIDRSGIAHRPMPTPVNGPQLGVGA